MEKKNKEVEMLQNLDIPITSTRLLTMISIEWAEANNIASFTQAYKEVMNEIVKKESTNLSYGEYIVDSPENTNLLVQDSSYDISIEDAKNMLRSLEINNPLYNTLVQESLLFYKQTTNPIVSKYILTKDYCDHIELKVDGLKDAIKFPKIILQKIIYDAFKANGFEYKVDEIENDTDNIKTIKSIKIPEINERWN